MENHHEMGRLRAAHVPVEIARQTFRERTEASPDSSFGAYSSIYGLDSKGGNVGFGLKLDLPVEIRRHISSFNETPMQAAKKAVSTVKPITIDDYGTETSTRTNRTTHMYHAGVTRQSDDPDEVRKVVARYITHHYPAGTDPRQGRTNIGGLGGAFDHDGHEYQGYTINAAGERTEWENPAKIKRALEALKPKVMRNIRNNPEEYPVLQRLAGRNIPSTMGYYNELQKVFGEEYGNVFIRGRKERHLKKSTFMNPGQREYQIEFEEPNDWDPGRGHALYRVNGTN